MVSMWDGVSTHGKRCPKCENGSVFLKEKLYIDGFIFKKHKYNLYKCEMDRCDFKKLISLEEEKTKIWI